MISRIRQGGFAGVPERVPLVARLEREITWLGVHHVIAEQRSQPALEDETVLIHTSVAVERRREMARRDRMFHEREPAARLFASDHEPYSGPAEIEDRAVMRTHDAWTLSRVEPSHCSSFAVSPK